jgi:hypothetical protein
LAKNHETALAVRFRDISVLGPFRLVASFHCRIEKFRDDIVQAGKVGDK